MTDAKDLSLNELTHTPLLPRSAWNSKLTHLKIVLQVKQSLDKSEKLNLPSNLNP